ncbi:hypothetical protein HDU96_006620, partial [Phlyctochytrium bullatum]
SKFVGTAKKDKKDIQRDFVAGIHDQLIAVGSSCPIISNVLMENGMALILKPSQNGKAVPLRTLFDDIQRLMFPNGEGDDAEEHRGITLSQYWLHSLDISLQSRESEEKAEDQSEPLEDVMDVDSEHDDGEDDAMDVDDEHIHEEASAEDESNEDADYPVYEDAPADKKADEEEDSESGQREKKLGPNQILDKINQVIPAIFTIKERDFFQCFQTAFGEYSGWDVDSSLRTEILMEVIGEMKLEVNVQKQISVRVPWKLEKYGGETRKPSPSQRQAKTLKPPPKKKRLNNNSSQDVPVPNEAPEAPPEETKVEDIKHISCKHRKGPFLKRKRAPKKRTESATSKPEIIMTPKDYPIAFQHEHVPRRGQVPAVYPICVVVENVHRATQDVLNDLKERLKDYPAANHAFKENMMRILEELDEARGLATKKKFKSSPIVGFGGDVRVVEAGRGGEDLKNWISVDIGLQTLATIMADYGNTYYFGEDLWRFMCHINHEKSVGKLKADEVFKDKDLLEWKTSIKCMDLEVKGRITKLVDEISNFCAPYKVVIVPTYKNSAATKSRDSNVFRGAKGSDKSNRVRFDKGRLLQEIKWKALAAGHEVLVGTEAFTTQTCSSCLRGRKVGKAKSTTTIAELCLRVLHAIGITESLPAYLIPLFKPTDSTLTIGDARLGSTWTQEQAIAWSHGDAENPDSKLMMAVAMSVPLVADMDSLLVEDVFETFEGKDGKLTGGPAVVRLLVYLDPKIRLEAVDEEAPLPSYHDQNSDDLNGSGK